MTDKNQAFPANLFGLQTSGASLNPTAFSVSGLGAERDNSFSRELSRATEMNQPSRYRERGSQRDSQSHSKSVSENSDYKTSEQRKPSEFSENANRSERSEVTEKAQTKTSRSKGATEGNESQNSKESRRTTETSHEATSNRSEIASVSDGSESEATDSPVDQSLASSTINNGNVIETENDQSIIADIPVVVVATSVENEVSALAKDTAGKLDTVAKMQLNRVGGNVNSAQLHNRQAHATLQSMEQPGLIDDKPGLLQQENSLKTDSASQKPVAGVGQLTSAGIVAGMNKVQAEVKSDEQGKSGIERSGVLAKVNDNSDELTLVSTQRRLNEAAALAEAKVNSELAQEQMRTQALETNQVQMRQQLQQQLLASGMMTAKSADAGNSMPDNMFLSLPGGIVTAPVVQRSEPGNAQLTNAPVNLPILQSDSDKAMASNIRWMVKENVKHAVVNVTPSGMGPISVSIGLEKDQMNISIVAMQGATREALDSMLPRLREQLFAQGHEGVKVDISDGRSEQSASGNSQQDLFSQQGDENAKQDGSSADSSQYSSDGASTSLAMEDLADDQSHLLIGKNGNILGGYDVYV